MAEGRGPQFHKVGITGANGILGKKLCELFGSRAVPITRKEMDISQPFKIDHYMQGHGRFLDLMIHCAALKHPATEDRRAAVKVNVCGTQHLSYWCERFAVPFIYISTDYVFDGQKGNYSEEDEPNPWNNGIYSITKYMGELTLPEYGMNKVFRVSFCEDNSWPYDGAYTDKHSNKDTVGRIAQLIQRLADNYHSIPGRVVHVGTSPKSFYDLAKRLKPDVKQMSCVGRTVPQNTTFNLSLMWQTLAKTDPSFAQEAMEW